MRLFGREIKFDFPILRKWQSFQSVNSNYSGGWWHLVTESFAGAWQSVVTIDSPRDLYGNSAIYACVSLIAEDIAKNRIKLLQYDADDFADEVRGGSPWNPVLRRPNRYQNRIQFITAWILSKLLHGNTYVLKERDARGVVRALYILDPVRVNILVADDGSVWYQLGRDDLNGTREHVTIPQSEIIHDRMLCLFHPLVGIGPIYAAGWAATVSNKITANSANFFANMSRPGGILTAPGAISDATVERLKTTWQSNYSGTNAGKVAVLADGLTYKTIEAVPAEQAQLVEQLKWTVEDIARPFHMPLFKIGGPVPSGATTETLQQIYYSDCLQSLIESMELCLDEGLELPSYLGVQLDLMNLLRMDNAAMNQTISDSIKGGWMSPNEGRRMRGLRPVAGGSTPYLQQQNFSLEALGKRDSQPDPFGKTPPPALPPAETEDDDDAEQNTRALMLDIEKEMAA